MNNIEGLEIKVEQLFADLFIQFDSVRFDLYVLLLLRH